MSVDVWRERLDQMRAEAESLRAQNDLLARCVRTLTAEVKAEHERGETAQGALREVMGELRQVCVILGGEGTAKSAIDLAEEACLAIRLGDLALDLGDTVQARHVERGDRYRRRALALLLRLRACRRWRWLDTAKAKNLVDQCSALHDKLTQVLGEQLYLGDARNAWAELAIKCDLAAEDYRQEAVYQHDRVWQAPGQLTSILCDAMAWTAATFPDRTVQDKARHLVREAHELASNPTDTGEIADVLILLADICRVTGVDMATAVEAKLAELRTRRWGQPDAEGVIEHLRGIDDG